MYWSQDEPIKEDRDKRLNFIRAGLEELDEPIKIKLRSIKWKPDGERYP